ncbi:cytochrome c biogenesis protein/redoxin [Ruminiclostridium josui]|uniref:cytochrome c biogenesis protein/redoxin n=1 Tax=Ruminiclostridium josui TaxID=1499 RepID=UPI000463CED2|nr:cytochrome c biogenesis protein/redoxin [Ruminiclostridium josui]
MIGNLTGTNSVSFILVFIEGILSFFSPCVIPLIPVYMGYLAGNGKKVLEDGTIEYERKKVFLNTIFFVLGISFSFFILGMSFTALGSFFSSNKLLLTRIGGVLIILLGLFQIGIFNLSFLQRERKIKMNLPDKKMNPAIALAMGFTFSFAWTPCIGPALSSVLIMASGATSSVMGNILVFVYAIGFLVPFLLLGLFTTQVLNLLKAKQKLLKYTVKVGGVILIIMGVMIFTGWMNGVSGYLNSISNNQQNNSQVIQDKSESKNTSDTSENQATEKDGTSSGEKRVIPAFDFTLTDQYGKKHKLSDYKGKVVFLNFWATWCPPCKKEMPDIEELYNKYNLNRDEVVFLGVANPKSEEYPNNQDVKKEEIKSFLEDNKYTFPTVFDETGEIFRNYNISAFPTTFMIDKEGNVLGYVPGMMTKDIMINVINQAIQATE